MRCAGLPRRTRTGRGRLRQGSPVRGLCAEHAATFGCIRARPRGAGGAFCQRPAALTGRDRSRRARGARGCPGPRCGGGVSSRISFCAPPARDSFQRRRGPPQARPVATATLREAVRAGRGARMRGLQDLCRWGDFLPAARCVLPLLSWRLVGHRPRDPLPVACTRPIFFVQELSLLAPFFGLRPEHEQRPARMAGHRTRRPELVTDLVRPAKEKHLRRVRSGSLSGSKDRAKTRRACMTRGKAARRGKKEGRHRRGL